jgi:hypothetical protein
LAFILGSVGVSGLTILLSTPLVITAAILIAIVAPGPGEYFFAPSLNSLQEFLQWYMAG